MEIIVYKGTTFSVFIDEIYLILHYHSCKATTLVESNDGSHLDSFDVLGPGRRILKEKVHPFVDDQMVKKNIVPYFSHM